MTDIEKLDKELKDAKDKIRRIEMYFKIGFAVAVIFGIGGSVGAKIIGNVNAKIQKIKEESNAIIMNIENAKTEAIGAIEVKKKTVLKEMRSHAESSVNDAVNNGFSADLKVTGNIWGKKFEEEYGESNWINIKKDAKCPNGTYVIGIQVSYGGTCHNECNKDGGIIRNIVLTCAEL